MRVPKSPHHTHKVMEARKVKSSGVGVRVGTKSTSDDELSDASTASSTSGLGGLLRNPDPAFPEAKKDSSLLLNSLDGVSAPIAASSSSSSSPSAGGLLNPGGYHRSRDRTRRSAVLKLLERKQAREEKEREKERKREQRERRARSEDALSFSANYSASATDNSSSSSSAFLRSAQQFSFARDRSWARVDSSKKKNRAFYSCTDVEDLDESEGGSANGYSPRLDRVTTGCRYTYSASARVDQPRAKSVDRLLFPDVPKTYISIGPGKPTRIREHSPAKASKGPEAENSPPPPVPPERRKRAESPLKNVRGQKPFSPRDESPSKVSDLLGRHSPLKSTELLKEIPPFSGKNNRRDDNNNSNNSKADQFSQSSRKRSFTTEKTIFINNVYRQDDGGPRNRRVSAPAMDLGSSPGSSSSSSSSSSARSSAEREFCCGSAFRPNSSCSSSEASSFSSSSLSGSTDSVNEHNSGDGLSRRRASLEKRFQERERTSRAPSPPERRRRPSAGSSSERSGKSNDSGNTSPGSSRSSGSASSSASSKLLYNLSSGYRYYRAQQQAEAQAASSASRRFSHGPQRAPRIRDGVVVDVPGETNTNNSNSNSNTYSSSSSSSSSKKRGRQIPIRKISLPPTCYEHPERSLGSARRWDRQTNRELVKDQEEAASGEGRTRTNSNSGETEAEMDIPPRKGGASGAGGFGGGGGGAYSKYKLCDDTLSYPGCCAEHDQTLYNNNPSSNPSSSPFSSTPKPNFSSSSSSNTNSLAAYKAKLKSGDSGLGELTNSSLLASFLYEGEEKEATPESDVFSAKKRNGSSSGSSEIYSAFKSDQKKAPSVPSSAASSSLLPPLYTSLPPIPGPPSSARRRPSIDRMSSVASESRDETGSISTVSGSGIDFFRKFVQRKSRQVAPRAVPAGCKDCESQFRREVLIDRLVTDSTSLRGGLEGAKSSKTLSVANSSCCSRCSKAAEEDKHLRGRFSRKSSMGSSRLLKQPVCNSNNRGLVNPESTPFDIQSVSTASRSSVTRSTVSGSGLKFLRNYLKKKKKLAKLKSRDLQQLGMVPPAPHEEFNSVPVPFPPQGDFYGPAYCNPSSQQGGAEEEGDEEDEEYEYEDDDLLEEELRHSIGSTIAELLNETFDSEDSELLNLDWGEDGWDEDGYELSSELLGLEEEDLLGGDGQDLFLPMKNVHHAEAEEEEEEEDRKTVIESARLSPLSPEAAETPVEEEEQEKNVSQECEGGKWTRVNGAGVNKGGGGEERHEEMDRKISLAARSLSASITRYMRQQSLPLEKGDRETPTTANCNHNKEEEEDEKEKVTSTEREEEEEHYRLYPWRARGRQLKLQQRNLSRSIAALSCISPEEKRNELSGAESAGANGAGGEEEEGGEERGKGEEGVGRENLSESRRKSSSLLLSEDEEDNGSLASSILRQHNQHDFSVSTAAFSSSGNDHLRSSANLQQQQHSSSSLLQDSPFLSSPPQIDSDLATSPFGPIRRNREELYQRYNGHQSTPSNASSRRSSIATRTSEEGSTGVLSRSAGTKSRLAEFWEQKVHSSTSDLSFSPPTTAQHPPLPLERHSFHRSISDGDRSDSLIALNLPSASSSSSFKPVLPSYYYHGCSPQEQRIHHFRDVTRRAAQGLASSAASSFGGSVSDLPITTTTHAASSHSATSTPFQEAKRSRLRSAVLKSKEYLI